MTMKTNHEDGFSLIEILVVVVIIGTLAAIAIPMYVNHQRAAKNTASISSVKQLRDAIEVARIKEGKTLTQITGTGCTACFWSNLDPLTVPATNTGWVAYKSALAKISDASDIDIRNLVDGYGRPLFIDENEGENGTCGKDSIASMADVKPWTLTGENNIILPLSSTACRGN